MLYMLLPLGLTLERSTRIYCLSGVFVVEDPKAARGKVPAPVIAQNFHGLIVLHFEAETFFSNYFLFATNVWI